MAKHKTHSDLASKIWFHSDFMLAVQFLEFINWPILRVSDACFKSWEEVKVLATSRHKWTRAQSMKPIPHISTVQEHYGGCARGGPSKAERRLNDPQLSVCQSTLFKVRQNPDGSQDLYCCRSGKCGWRAQPKSPITFSPSEKHELV